MLRSMKELLGYELLAKDGLMGKVHNFLFSDEDRIVRYLVVDTGPWILGRKVLISLQALGQPVWASGTFPVELTREQIKNSPDGDMATPLSRQYEERLHQHYNWPAYWGMAAAIPGRPAYIPPQIFFRKEEHVEEYKIRSHLQSSKELLGYQMNATDGKIGSVADFLVEDEDWQLRFMVVDVSNWLDTDRQILMALEWITSIDVAMKEVFVELKQETIKYSPPFDPALPVNRQYEEVLYDYYGRPRSREVIE